MRYLEKINNSLKKLMKNNKDLYLIGEDMLDPYGGAFKVTKEISSLSCIGIVAINYLLLEFIFLTNYYVC